MHRLRAIALLLAVMAALPARAEAPRVCFDPARPCPGFKPNDLSFPLATDGKARADQRSAPFFAVMLKPAKRCAVKGAEAAEIQALFPDRKVFYSRFECDGDVESNVSYSNVDPKTGFIAVYAGESRGTANEALARVKSLNRFPGANLRSLQVIYNSP
jgi:hypothetical protein